MKNNSVDSINFTCPDCANHGKKTNLVERGNCYFCENKTFLFVENIAIHRINSSLNHSKTINDYVIDAELCSQIDNVNSYMNRSVLIDKRTTIRCQILFITGSLANNFFEVKNLYEEVQNSLKNVPNRKRLIKLMEVDECANVLVERTDRVAESLQYFLQGLGLASAAPSRRMSNSIGPLMGRKISMEQYDAPKGVANITYNPRRKNSESDPI